MELVRYAERPDLREIRLETLSRRTFPEYMHQLTEDRAIAHVACRLCLISSLVPSSS